MDKELGLDWRASGQLRAGLALTSTLAPALGSDCWQDDGRVPRPHGACQRGGVSPQRVPPGFWQL